MLNRRSLMKGALGILGASLTEFKLPRIFEYVSAADIRAAELGVPGSHLIIKNCALEQGDPYENAVDYITVDGPIMKIENQRLKVAGSRLILPNRIQTYSLENIKFDGVALDLSNVKGVMGTVNNVHFDMTNSDEDHGMYLPDGGTLMIYNTITYQQHNSNRTFIGSASYFPK